MKDDDANDATAPCKQAPSGPSPERYRIQVQGSADSSLARYLEMMDISIISLSSGASTTELTVQVADQSVLTYLLEQIFTRRLPLISVDFLGTVRDAACVQHRRNDEAVVDK